MMAKPVDQSRTQWNPAVKNAAGKFVQKGYLSQKGKPEKRVTSAVRLVTETGGKRAGQTQKYSSGRKVVGKTPAFGGGGSNPAADKGGGLTAAQIAARKAAQDAKNKKMSYQTGREAPKAGAAKRSAAQAKTMVTRARSASQASKYAQVKGKLRWDNKSQRWVTVSNPK
jgi:transcription elongation factor